MNDDSKILLLTAVTIIVLLSFFAFFWKAIKGKDGVMDKQDIMWPIYTVFVGYAMFLGNDMSDFKFACLIGGSAGVDMVTSILSVWKMKKNDDSQN